MKDDPKVSLPAGKDEVYGQFASLDVTLSDGSWVGVMFDSGTTLTPAQQELVDLLIRFDRRNRKKRKAS